MEPGITWYDILNVATDASSEEIGQAYQSKAGLLVPELISGAPSKVAAAAAQAQGILDAARQVLADPVNRERYDEAALRRSGGLGQLGDFPSQPGGGLSDYDVAAGNPGADVLGSLMALNDWLDRHPRHQRQIPVPDVRGLFYDVFLEVVGRLELHVTTIDLTEHAMPVDGLVVGQSPGPPATIRRAGGLTVQVWHPAARATEDPPGGRLTPPPA